MPVMRLGGRARYFDRVRVVTDSLRFVHWLRRCWIAGGPDAGRTKRHNPSRPLNVKPLRLSQWPALRSPARQPPIHVYSRVLLVDV